MPPLLADGVPSPDDRLGDRHEDRIVREPRGEDATPWATTSSIAGRVGRSAGTFRGWGRRAERETRQRAGVTTDDRERRRVLEREHRALRRANAILREAAE